MTTALVTAGDGTAIADDELLLVQTYDTAQLELRQLRQNSAADAPMAPRWGQHGAKSAAIGPVQGTVRAGRRDVSATAADLATFVHAVRFVSVDPAKNRYRFYTLSWQPSLWEEAVLLLRWGRLGTAGKARMRAYPNRESAQPEIARVIRRRLLHGYALAERH